MSTYNKIIEAAMNSATSAKDKAVEYGSKALDLGKRIVNENPKTTAGLGGLAAGGMAAENLIQNAMEELKAEGYSEEQIIDYIINNYNIDELGEQYV